MTVKKVRKQLFAAKPSGVPDDLQMFWVKPIPQVGGAGRFDEEFAEGCCDVALIRSIAYDRRVADSSRPFRRRR